LLRRREQAVNFYSRDRLGFGSNRGTDIEIRLLVSLSVPESSSIAPAVGRAIRATQTNALNAKYSLLVYTNAICTGDR
jgi:hypothetical protein